MAEEIKVPGNKEEWLKFWNEWGSDCDHPETDPCPMLQKHLDKLVNGKKNAKIFVPLCTKSIDLKWLADQGHTVVGLEVAESCIQSFFKEQKLEFTVEMGLGGKAKIYKAVNHNIKLYVADFFDFNKEAEGQFDGVWDRRAMISLNKDQYPRYVALIKTLLAPDGRCLFVNADFDRTTCPVISVRVLIKRS
ncbi:thiopurine S-methyltransferase-like isoform X3 [Liolophura sinensis]|uniref:thiopurine S-methyltransferase-like isoform X3 n=1 Tax=Liolophura sinensis TaxID=3198878 RepID=UPI0031591486